MCSKSGFPDSFLASSDRVSLGWRQNFLRSYLERDIPQFGVRIPAETLRRFLTMIAHHQSGILNAAALARNLAIDGKTVMHYLDLLIDLLLARRLPAWHANIGKRLVKSPKILIRDTGLVHALLNIDSEDSLLSHPILGASWESFVIENLLRVAPDGTTGHFYQTAAGAEIDLLLEMPGGDLWAIEIKRTSAPKIEKGFYVACNDLKPAHAFIVYGGTERFVLGSGIEAISFRELTTMIGSGAS